MCRLQKQEKKNIWFEYKFEWSWHLSVVTLTKVKSCTAKEKIICCTPFNFCMLWHMSSKYLLVWMCVCVFFSTSVHFVVQKFVFMIYIFFDGECVKSAKHACDILTKIEENSYVMTKILEWNNKTDIQKSNYRNHARITAKFIKAEQLNLCTNTHKYTYTH